MIRFMCYNCLQRLHPFSEPVHFLVRLSCMKSSSDVLSVCRANCIWTAGKVRFSSAQVKRKQPGKRSKDEQSAHDDYPFMPSVATQQVYVLNNTLAGQIVKAVRTNQMHADIPVLESNPGPGIVTKNLLQAGVKQVVAVETLDGFIAYMQKLQKKVGPKKLIVFQWQSTSASLPEWNPATVYRFPEEDLTTLFPKRDEASDPPFSVLSLIPHEKERQFLKCLLNQWAVQQGLFTAGQPEWFLLTSASFYKSLVVADMKENRPTKQFANLAVVLLLMFDIQMCAELPGHLFSPAFPQKRRKTTVRTVLPEVTENMRYLIRFRPLPDTRLSPAEVPAFYSFLRQILQKRKDRVIPKMEQLIPDCGIRLIIMGVTMMTKSGDLSIDMMLDIFKTMQTWPEFKGSPMKRYLSDTIMLPADEETPDDA